MKGAFFLPLRVLELGRYRLHRYRYDIDIFGPISAIVDIVYFSTVWLTYVFYYRPQSSQYHIVCL